MSTEPGEGAPTPEPQKMHLTEQYREKTGEGTPDIAEGSGAGLTKISADLHAHRELPVTGKKLDTSFYEEAARGLDYKQRALSNPWPEDERRGGEPVSFKEGLMELLARRDEVLADGVGRVLENELAIDEQGKPLPEEKQDAAWRAIAEAARRHVKVNPAPEYRGPEKILENPGPTYEPPPEKLNKEPNSPTEPQE